MIRYELLTQKLLEVASQNILQTRLVGKPLKKN